MSVKLLHFSTPFLAVSLVAGLIGFGGDDPHALHAMTGQVVFVVFLVLFMLSVLFGGVVNQ